MWEGPVWSCMVLCGSVWSLLVLFGPLWSLWVPAVMVMYIPDGHVCGRLWSCMVRLILFLKVFKMDQNGVEYLKGQCQKYRLKIS